MSNWDHLCAISLIHDDHGDDVDVEDGVDPSGNAAAPPNRAGEDAWEDEGILQWKLQLMQPAYLTVVRELQWQHRQLVLIEPTESFDLRTGAEVGIAWESQWWQPGTPMHCNLVNRTKAQATVSVMPSVR